MNLLKEDLRQETKLVRNLGFLDLMGIAIGQIIGAGIMSITGTAIGMTGTGIVPAFLISAFLTLITIAPIAYMSAAVPAAGGAYKYTSRLLGKKLGFIYLILFLTTNLTLALYALTFASYWVSVLPGNEKIISIIMITIFYIINLIGTKSAAKLNVIVCILMVGGILIFTGYGIPKVNFEYIFNKGNLFTNGKFGFISAVSLLSFASTGGQFLAELGGEAKNPGKNIPRAMIISTLGVAVLYSLMACVASGVLPIEITANKPLTIVANQILPKNLFYFFVFGSAIGASASTLNSMFSWVSKAYLVACDDGILPQSFATLNKKGVPYKILTVFYIIGLIPLLAGLDISFMSKIGSSSSLACKVLLCLALTKIYTLYPDKMKNSVLKISPLGAKILGIFSALLCIVMSSSIIFSLPRWAITIFVIIILLGIIIAKFGLKKVEIPKDLDIVYNINK